MRDAVALTKPRISLLVLVTAWAAMWLASGHSPDGGLVAWTLLGTALAAGSSSVLNNLADRRHDALMERTKSRALPAGRVSPAFALWWGVALGFAGVGVLAWATTPMAALIAAGGVFFYVGVYTLWLKRTTPLSTAVGGVAGAVGPLIGWAAVTGGVGVAAWVLFILIFLWQPPHFWALALPVAKDYERAGYPLLPVVAGEEATKRQILWWTVALVPASLAPALVSPAVGPLYLWAALALGTVYLWRTIAFVRGPAARGRALRLFGASVLYLFALFGALVADAALGALAQPII